MADRDVSVDIVARDKTDRGTRSAIRNFDNLKRNVDKSNNVLNRFTDVTKRISGIIVGATKRVAKAAAVITSVASASAAAGKSLLILGNAVNVAGRAFTGLAPLLAFIPILVGGIGALVGTIKLVGPAFVKAFEPITRQFFNAKGEATALTKRIQALATKGVEPLSKEFVRLNMPTITKGMSRIAIATNNVVVGVGKWLNTIPGQKLIQTTIGFAATSAERLAPRVRDAAIALGNLAGRAGNRNLRTLTNVIDRILRKFIEWANSTSFRDIQNAIHDLSGYFGRLKNAFNAVRDIGGWMADNEPKVRKFANAIAALGLALAVLTMNPFGAAIAGLTLLVNNWEKLKEKLGQVAPWFSSLWTSIKNDPNIKGIWESMKTAFGGFVDSFKNQTTNLKEKFSELITALKKAWDEWGPVIKAWWDGVGKPVFSALGTVLGWLLTKFLSWSINVINGLTLVGRGFRGMVVYILNQLGAVISGAAKAFGWMPGIGPKLRKAEADFNAFRDRVNAALAGIKDRNVKVNVTMSVSDQAARAMRGAGYGVFSGEHSWRPAQVAAQFASGGSFAASTAGTSRTDGPVKVENNLSVSLDGTPFYSYTAKAISESERRRQFRTKVGRR